MSEIKKQMAAAKMLHEIELNDQQLATLRNALAGEFKTRFDMSSKLLSTPGLEHIGKAVLDSANEIDELLVDLPRPTNLKSR